MAAVIARRWFMASSKDMFEANMFEAGMFASALYRGIGVTLEPAGNIVYRVRNDNVIFRIPNDNAVAAVQDDNPVLNADKN